VSAATLKFKHLSATAESSSDAVLYLMLKEECMDSPVTIDEYKAKYQLAKNGQSERAAVVGIGIYVTEE